MLGLSVDHTTGHFCSRRDQNLRNDQNCFRDRSGESQLDAACQQSGLSVRLSAVRVQQLTVPYACHVFILTGVTEERHGMSGIVACVLD
jgi:hypothetical protein